MRKTSQKAAIALSAILPCAAFAAAPQLFVHRVQIDRQSWPRARGYATIVSATGGPMPAIGPDLFRVYEGGSSASSKIIKAETLEAAGTGASIVLVVQASGAMGPIAEELKRALAGFIGSLGEKDAAGCVSYGDGAELVAPLSLKKDQVLRKCGAIALTAKSFLLYDGLLRAISAFPDDGGSGELPAPRAIVLLSDGRDNGSSADFERVVAEATRRGIPIDAVGHSELDQESLAQLQQIARRTSGTYQPAPAAEDIGRALDAVRDFVHRQYVIEWKTDLPHDGKEHRVEIALVTDVGTVLESAVTARTPAFFDWLRSGVYAGLVLLAAILGTAAWLSMRKRSSAARRCPACNRVQMPDWDACLFCLESAKARLFVQKGLDKGKQYPLVGKVVSLGSGPENTIRLADGAVSGKHAGLSIDEDRFEIVDLGSRNGVLVNGKKTPRKLLADGDVITLGITELKFEALGAKREAGEAKK